MCGGGGGGGQGEGVHSVLEWVSMCVRKSEKKDNFFWSGLSYSDHLIRISKSAKM